MLRTTLKGIRAHKGRLVMTALAVVLGVALMAGTLVLTDTMGKTFDDLVADIYDGTDAVVRSSEAIDTQFGEVLRQPIDVAVLDDVRAVDGVAEAEGFIQGFAMVVGPDGKAISNPGGAPTLGMAWGETEALNPFVLVEGGPPTRDDQVVIDKATADRAGVGVGDQVTILSATEPRELTLSGVVRFGEIDSPGGATVSMFTPTTARELMGLPVAYNEIGVVAVDGLSQEELVERLSASLPEGAEAITGEVRTAEDQQAFRDALGFFNTFLLVFALVALFVGAFIIYNTFSIIVAQRTRELALLRAIGASRRQVLGSVMGEAVLVGLAASALGAAAGIGVAVVLRAMLGAFGIDIPATSPVVSPVSMAIAVGTGLTITVLAAVFPARRASKIAPVAALREVAVDTSATSKKRIVIGAVITGLGVLSLISGLSGGENAAASVGTGVMLVFLGVAVLGPVIARPVTKVIGAPLVFGPLARPVGVAGRLARENASRSPKRTAATAAALMIGVGLVGFITIFASSMKASFGSLLEESVAGDLVIAAEGFDPTAGFSPALAAQVAEIDGIENVTGLRFAFGEIDGSGIVLLSLQADSIDAIADVETTAGDLAALGDGDLAVADRVARAEGWAIGDTVDVSFQGGTEPLTLAATFGDEYVVLLGDYVLDLSTHERVVPQQIDLQVFITLTPDADVDAVRAAVEERAAPYANAQVQDLIEYRDSQLAVIDQLLALIYVMLALAIVIALIGIANTLALSIYERTRELGLLRAVGMTRPQMATTVLWESVLIALLGTAMGLVIGLFFGWSLVQALASEGLDVFNVPGGQLVVIVVLAALAGVLAALLPARRATRVDILRAITTE